MQVIVLAAGQGTRMNSDKPKVLHELGGAPLVVHAMKTALAMAPERLVVVAGVGFAAVKAAVTAYWPQTVVAEQPVQRGTGDAVLCARSALQGATGDAVVLYGDTPFVTPQTLGRMQMARAQADVIVLGFESRPEERYGRLVTEGDDLHRIVEYKDADAATRAITLHNSGVVMADCALLMDLLAGVTPENAAGEYYLTDIVALARARGLTARVVRCDEAETLGVNTRAHLAQAEAIFQAGVRLAALAAGATLIAPETVFLAHDTVLGRDCVIEPHVVFGPGVRVDRGARIRAFSHLEGCEVAEGAIVGPYARLRPGAQIGPQAHVGNFVEVKAAQIGEGAKVNHLTYLGDATIGAGTNVGAGTITCNYDGVFKHRTIIGAQAFIGSNTMLVAPVQIGDGAMTASGSVITQDVPAGALGIGRARQATKPGFATKFMARLKALKAQKGR